MFFYVMLLSFILGIGALIVAFKTKETLTRTMLTIISIILIGYAVFLAWPH
ncbi:hypothetical protein [Leuconostoc falkenbergense]|uniref:hypothetical protein n=1 Tax=Leuconostoc falkenbergense TaxID=2766470 RepID=UPI0039EBFF69